MEVKNRMESDHNVLEIEVATGKQVEEEVQERITAV